MSEGEGMVGKKGRSGSENVVVREKKSLLPGKYFAERSCGDALRRDTAERRCGEAPRRGVAETRCGEAPRRRAAETRCGETLRRRAAGRRCGEALRRRATQLLGGYRHACGAGTSSLCWQERMAWTCSTAAPELSKAASLSGIDVVATRIWLDKYVPTDTPANVFSRFEGLRGAGGTFFMLDQLQKDTEDELWGGETPQGSVLACDFYNGGAVACMSDEDIVSLLVDELLPAAVPEFKVHLTPAHATLTEDSATGIYWLPFYGCMVLTVSPY
ncbi:hypothetical protein CYMTET_11607 [Cymbomonas tetramitiformis]|uniref:Uncharacterized protein n=1 Tax=Cymbomonas tetramitiformis TaxID=36881 RepID=A0AAE0LD00_9CHLO|nr:hypothetical protein CYMTET_11607 [Cymbomonas tetramitiformis]